MRVDPVAVTSSCDDGFARHWVLMEDRFDLSQLNAIAAHFDLLVGPAKKLNGTVRSITPKVAGPI